MSGGGQAHGERGAAFRPGSGADRAAVALDDRLHERETQPRVAVVALLLVRPVAVEAREDQLLASRREPRPLVGDGGDRPAALASELDVYRPVPRRERPGVV